MATTTTKNVPPAGTKTHKPTCGCFACKAGRYDALVVRITELEGHADMLQGRLMKRAAELGQAKDALDAAKDLQDRTADDLGAALAEVDRLEKRLNETTSSLKLAQAGLDSQNRDIRNLKTSLEAAQDVIDSQKQSLELSQVHSIGERFLYALIVVVAAALGLGAGIVAGRYGR